MNMVLNDINDQLRLKTLEVSITKDSKKKREVQDQLKVLQYKKEIEIIKKKIKQLS